MEEIGVSVLCATYNQEKYIRQALESFVMQKTNFPFEVIVNDDASTDETPEIIKEYADKYPNIIKPVYQKENQYSKGIFITIECLYPKAKGKYLAWCEGDDFWTDENKLQLQYDIMEKNSNCHLCVHKVQDISENGENIRVRPFFNVQEKLMNTEEFFKIIFFYFEFQTSSYFVRRTDYSNYITDFVKIRQKFRQCGVGDHPLLFYFGLLNGIYYIDKIMSKYRRNSLGSWSVRNQNNYQRFYCYIEAMEEFDKYTSYKYHKLCMLRMLKFGILVIKSIRNRKELLLKHREKLFRRFTLFQKSILLMYIFFPNLGRIYHKIYRILNGMR
ncbi:MAG: glycosyltransferase [Elusimicrobia bacterium]|nr:glycosyltransferase [Elusimicrobiota bacterium]